MRKGDATPDIGQFPRPFGKYVLLDHLATGGMADVFLARQSGPAGFTKECVIKRILPHLARDRQFVTMFLDEARLCARLSHPNIAAVYDLGQIEDDYYIAMEYVHGVNLERALYRAAETGERHLPYGLAARVIAAIADGLEHAHHAAGADGRPLGMVHRDVSPGNIMVSFDGVPKLLDFGVAKAATQEARTEVGVVKGKVWYMAPEQMQFLPIDGRADVFSLAAVLYELTTGKRPWPGDSVAQVSTRILHEEAPSPTRTDPHYPEELETILFSALAKDPDERTASARALQVQLERFMMATGHHASTAEVAVYLAEHFPDERVRPVRPASDAATAQTEQTPMPERPRQTNASLAIGDASSVIGDLPQGGGAPERRGRGGGPWMAVVMVALVVAVGVALIALRSYENRKEGKAAAAVVDLAPAVAVAPEPVAPPPAALPDAAKVAVQPAAPETTPIADPPKVTPLVAPPTPKAEGKHSSRPKRPASTPAQLPHLPSPPPATE